MSVTTTPPNSLRCRGSDGSTPRPALCPQRGNCRRYIVHLADPERRLNETARTLSLPRVGQHECHYFMEVGDASAA
jgi:hypothetical protein